MSSNPAQAWIFSGLMFTTAQVVFIKAKIAFNYSHTITWLVFFSLSGVSHSRTEIKNSCNYCCIKSKLTWYSYSFTMHDGWPSWCILCIQCFCFQSSRNSLVTFSYFVKHCILFVKEQQITPAFKVSIIQSVQNFPSYCSEQHQSCLLTRKRSCLLMIMWLFP